MNILALLRSRFAAALAELCDDPQPYLDMVRPAQDPQFGDFQANCAMPLAGKLKQKPRDVAAAIVERLDVVDLCEPPTIAGPGFINLRLRDDWIASQTQRIAADERLGVAAAASPNKYVVDYSAPNVAKPMHVGHLRSTVIGDALRRVLAFLGHEVVGDNHIGDWGTQFGMIIYGFKHFRDPEAYVRDPVAELARLYRLVNQLADYHDARHALPELRQKLADQQQAVRDAEAAQLPDEKSAKKRVKKLQGDLETLRGDIAAAERKLQAVESAPQLRAMADAHPNIAAAAREETARLHAGDLENQRLWEEFLPVCLDALEKVYQRLGIEFDLTLGESYYHPLLSGVVDDLATRGLARESAGAMCVFHEGNEAPFIIRKSDGAFTYATTDLATIRYRIDDLKADAILYVVDARQSEHFQLLFATARKWGYDETELRHVTFGTVLGEDRRPFKTRAGDTIGLESLLNEAVARARTIVDENDDAKRDAAGNPTPELDEAERARVAEVVGIGGIKYADLRHNRESDYVFSWDKMLAKTGDTATYIQYSFARACGILRKGEVERSALRQPGEPVRLEMPSERSLALLLCRFVEAVEDVAVDWRPNVLAQYLFETANQFNLFYDHCPTPIIREPDEALRTSRYRLCDLTARVLQRGLGLLGIETAERM